MKADYSMQRFLPMDRLDLESEHDANPWPEGPLDGPCDENLASEPDSEAEPVEQPTNVPKPPPDANRAEMGGFWQVQALGKNAQTAARAPSSYPGVRGL